MSGPDPQGTSLSRRAFALAAAVALLAALPYLIGDLSRLFVAFDDDIYIYENLQVRQGLTNAGLRWAFTTFHASNWHPLTWLSHMLDVSIFGLDARGHHLTSILLHALNAALFFLALLRLTGRAWPATFAAALFGVHPLHVESVAWAAERKDVLAGLFFMLVLLAYERYARRGGAARYLLVAALLALGLMAKPMLVTVPFVLLLLDVWPLGRAPRRLPAESGHGEVSWGRLLLEKVPLLALSAASAVVTIAAQRSSGAVGNLDSFPPALRLANALGSLAAYLGKTLWPSSLALYYPYPRAAAPWWLVAGALALLTVLAALAVRNARRRPWLLGGWCWFVGMLVPVIGIVQVGDQAMADRYTYLPLCGVFIMVAWAARMPTDVKRLPRAATAAGAALVVVLFAAAAANQAGRWRDSETIFRHTLAVTRDNWMIRYNLGIVLTRAGRHEEAVAAFRESLRLRPDYPNTHKSLAVALAALGRREEAAASFREAVRLEPGSPEAWYNLGMMLVGLRRYDEAAASLREALRLRPDYTAARIGLAVVSRSGTAFSRKDTP